MTRTPAYPPDAREKHMSKPRTETRIGQRCSPKQLCPYKEGTLSRKGIYAAKYAGNIAFAHPHLSTSSPVFHNRALPLANTTPSFLGTRCRQERKAQKQTSRAHTQAWTTTLRAFENQGTSPQMCPLYAAPAQPANSACGQCVGAVLDPTD